MEIVQSYRRFHIVHNKSGGYINDENQPYSSKTVSEKVIRQSDSSECSNDQTEKYLPGVVGAVISMVISRVWFNWMPLGMASTE